MRTADAEHPNSAFAFANAQSSLRGVRGEAELRSSNLPVPTI